jgi:hypothetical protein
VLNESALRPAHLEALDVLILATPRGAIILAHMANFLLFWDSVVGGRRRISRAIPLLQRDEVQWTCDAACSRSSGAEATTRTVARPEPFAAASTNSCICGWMGLADIGMQYALLTERRCEEVQRIFQSRRPGSGRRIHRCCAATGNRREQITYCRSRPRSLVTSSG